MINLAIEYLGAENLENIALEWHVPKEGIYIIVDNDGSYSVINEKRVRFNSKLNGMDYYSELVTINKPISSKLITSNGFLTFFVKNASKLKDADIDKYYDKCDLPPEKLWHKHWIKNNIYRLSEEYNGEYIKVFFPGARTEYRECAWKNWWNKSVSFTNMRMQIRGNGFPISINTNIKKPFLNNFKPHLVKKDDGLNIKIFYDILRGMRDNGKNMIVLNEKGYYAFGNKDEHIYPPGSIVLGFNIDRNGKIGILYMDTNV